MRGILQYKNRSIFASKYVIGFVVSGMQFRMRESTAGARA